ncbi:MAG: hypothetical protein ACOH2M_32495 [Cypionkella sp.]
MGKSESRHPDLAPLRTTLAWFYATLAHGDEPMGRAANDNGEKYTSSVPDRNPKPDSAEKAIADWHAGGMRTATKAGSTVQFVRIAKDEYERKRPEVTVGTITHVWGKRVTQDAAKPAPPSRSKAAKAARKADQEWWTAEMGGAQFATPRKLLFKWRKKLPAIDWAAFAHVQGNVPFAEARAACGLPPALPLPLGFPYQPHPSALFRGRVTGRGSSPGYGQDGEPVETIVRRAHDDDYAAAGFIVDRIALSQFEVMHPEHFATLLTGATAGSMGDLVASNDNATGKRKLIRAGEALKLFLAA